MAPDIRFDLAYMQLVIRLFSLFVYLHFFALDYFLSNSETGVTLL